VWNSELRFASSWDSTFQVLVGGFYQRTKSVLQTEFITLGDDGRIGPSSRSLLNNTVRDKKTERAAFGELRWEGIDGLTVTGGARVFKFKIDAQGNVITAPFEQPGAGFGVPYGTSQSDAIFKGNISYQFNSDVMAYAQVAEGYRPGGANDQAVTLLTGVPIPLGFNSDSIVNYELGFKTSWLNRAVTFNGALYVIDWSDIQVRRKAVNTATGVQYDFRGNGGTAKVKGIELETQVRPIAGLEFGGSLAYTDAKLTEDLPVLDDGRKGDRIPYVPKWTFSANARYEMRLGEGVSGFVGGDWSYTGSSGNRLRPTDRYYRVNQSYGITNLRVGVELDNDWDIVLSLKNVFDSKRTIFYAFDFQGPPPPGGFVPDNLVRPWPRTLALSVRKSIF
jgi:iron complex outermembrane recepter protein